MNQNKRFEKKGIAENGILNLHSNKVLKNNSKPLKGFLVLLASALSFSLMTVCVKHLRGRVPIAEIVLARAVFSLLLTRLMLKSAGISPWGIDKKLLLLRGFLGTAALFCVFEAINRLSLASATVLQYTYPTFVAVAAAFFLGEKITSRIGLAVIAGWIGITMIVNPSWINPELEMLSAKAVCIALGGSVLTALAYVSVRKLSKTEHPLVIVHYFPLVSVPISIPFLINNGVWPIGMDWIWLIGVGIFTQLGQIWITEGLSILPAAQACSINYAQVLFSAIWGALIFSEGINKWWITGSIFILLSTALCFTDKNQKKSNISQETRRIVNIN